MSEQAKGYTVADIERFHDRIADLEKRLGWAKMNAKHGSEEVGDWVRAYVRMEAFTSRTVKDLKRQLAEATASLDTQDQTFNRNATLNALFGQIATAAGVDPTLEPGEIERAVCELLEKLPLTEDGKRITEGTVTYCGGHQDGPDGIFGHQWAIRNVAGETVAEHCRRHGERQWSASEVAEHAQAGGAITGFGADPDLKPGPLTPEDRGWRPT